MKSYLDNMTLDKYRDKFEAIAAILQKDDPIVVEIGAHYGEDTLRFMHFFKNVTIHCFEPDPRNIAVFKKYIDDERCTLYECALGNIDCTDMEFYLGYTHFDQASEMQDKYKWINKDDYIKYNLNNSGSSSLKPSTRDDLRNTEVTSVQCRRLDTWFQESGLESIDFMWIDVQGAEKEVIEGSGKTLPHLKYIWIEYGQATYEGALTRKETIELLDQHQFNVAKEYSAKKDKGDLLFFNRGLVNG